MINGSGLGLTLPLVSHRGGGLSTDAGLGGSCGVGCRLDTTPLGRDLLTRRLPRPVSA